MGPAAAAPAPSPNAAVVRSTPPAEPPPAPSRLALPEPLLTKEQVAVHCQVCLRTVDAWMKRGALKFRKLGKSVRFRPSDVEAHLATFYGGRTSQ